MLSDFFVDCCMMDKRTVADGFGGITTEWVDGAEFSAGITRVSSNEAMIAYQNGLKVMYNVVFDENITLTQNDRIKRLNDGLVLRITSASRDMTTPAVSEVKYSQVSAEVIDL